MQTYFRFTYIARPRVLTCMLLKMVQAISSSDMSIFLKYRPRFTKGNRTSWLKMATTLNRLLDEDLIHLDHGAFTNEQLRNIFNRVKRNKSPTPRKCKTRRRLASQELKEYIRDTKVIEESQRELA